RSFHPDQATGQISKKRRHRSTTQGFAHDNVPTLVNAMNLKHVLCQVQAYPNDLHDDPPSLQFTSDIRPGRRAGSIPLAPAAQILTLCGTSFLNSPSFGSPLLGTWNSAKRTGTRPGRASTSLLKARRIAHEPSRGLPSPGCRMSPTSQTVDYSARPATVA